MVLKNLEAEQILYMTHFMFNFIFKVSFFSKVKQKLKSFDTTASFVRINILTASDKELSQLNFNLINVCFNGYELNADDNFKLEFTTVRFY